MKLERNPYTPYVLLVYIILIVVASLLMGCSNNLYVGSRYSKCPTNDKTYFYKRMGVKPPKSYMRWSR